MSREREPDVVLIVSRSRKCLEGSTKFRVKVQDFWARAAVASPRRCYGTRVQHGVAGRDPAAPRGRGELLRLLCVPAGHLVRGQNHPRLRHRRPHGAALLPAVGSRLRGPLLLLQRMWRAPAQLLHGRTRVGVELRDGTAERQAGAPGPQPAASVRTGPGLLPPPGGGLRRHRGPVGLQLQDLAQVFFFCCYTKYFTFNTTIHEKSNFQREMTPAAEFDLFGSFQMRKKRILLFLL